MTEKIKDHNLMTTAEINSFCHELKKKLINLLHEEGAGAIFGINCMYSLVFQEVKGRAVTVEKCRETMVAMMEAFINEYFEEEELDC